MQPVPVLVSAVEHYSYCPRQCGLIHLEGVFDENVFTMRGRIAHERVDEQTTRMERGIRIERALPIWSQQYQLVGRADVVEFHPDGRIVPVEYKSGRSNNVSHASLQLCAQALCLEEMFGLHVDEGALYFVADRTKVQVEICDILRQEATQVIDRIAEMLEGRVLPPPVADRRCPKCSLVDACQPHLLANSRYSISDLFEPRSPAELP